MRTIITHIGLFGLFFCLQVFVFNKLELGFGAQIFLLPLFLMVLPFEMNVFTLMGLGFVLGISVDALSNTYGLNASTLVLFAYLRPIVFESFRPREGYDPLKIPTANDMGWDWFLIVYGILFTSSLLWYFIWEIFRFSEILLVLRNLLTSIIASGIAVSISQFFFFNGRRKQ
jgi:rod shape-determining protein MreD